jgi:hypothetical protein
MSITKLPVSLPPRGLNIDQAAEYWGVCPSTFKKLVKRGVAPGPMDMAGFERNVYDRVALDAAINARSSVRQSSIAAAEPERASG